MIQHLVLGRSTNFINQDVYTLWRRLRLLLPVTYILTKTLDPELTFKMPSGYVKVELNKSLKQIETSFPLVNSDVTEQWTVYLTHG